MGGLGDMRCCLVDKISYRGRTEEGQGQLASQFHFCFPFLISRNLLRQASFPGVVHGRHQTEVDGQRYLDVVSCDSKNVKARERERE